MIDLLPASGKKEIRKEYHLRVFTVCLAMLSLTLSAMVLSFLPTYLFTISRYEAFLSESQSDAAQNRLSQVKEMETVVRDTNKKIDVLKTGAGTYRVKDIFLEVLENKSQGVAITSLSYDSGDSVAPKKGKENVPSQAIVSVQGIASDRTALLGFKDALSQKKEFGTIDLPISSLVKDTDLSFSINLNLVPAPAEKTK